MKLRVATCQFPIGSDVRKNLEYVARQIKTARDRDADVAHFPEACLSGYAGVDFASHEGGHRQGRRRTRSQSRSCFQMLDRALNKVHNELTQMEQDLSWSEPDRRNVRRSVGRRNAPLKRTERLVDELYVTVQGDEKSILAYNKTLFQRFSEVQAIGRQRADPALGDETLAIRLRSLRSLEHARWMLEQAADETGVILSALTYSQFEP